MRTSRKTDFRKLKIALVTMTYHSQRPQCPSLSPHVLLVLFEMFGLFVISSTPLSSVFKLCFINAQIFDIRFVYKFKLTGNTFL